MVNLLEGVYAATAISFLVTIVALIRKRYRAARIFGALAVVGAATAAVLYWYLAPA